MSSMESLSRRHPSGIAYRRGYRNGELLYQIQGSDGWLSENDFTLRCQINRGEVPRTFHMSIEPTSYQGPLRGPGPHDSRLFPAGVPREDQSARSAYESDRGAATSLVYRTRTSDVREVSQSAPKSIDSTNYSIPLPAPLSQLSTLARDFVRVGLGKYRESEDFISDNPSILAQNEIDALVAEALTAEKAGQQIRSQTCVHQALLLRKCTEVGLDNIGSFLRDLAARDSKARESFLKDVKKVYLSIQERAARAPLQNQAPPSGSQGRSLISQPGNGSASQNPSTYTQGSKEPTQNQTPTVQGSDGRLRYRDPEGNIASSRRYDRERYRSRTASAERMQSVALMEIGERTRDDAIPMPYSGRERHPTSLHGLNSEIERSFTGANTISVQPLRAASPRNMCGLAINVKHSKDRSATIQTVTIGGCLCIDSRYYGFTVAHVLSVNSQSHSDRIPKHESLASKSWEADTNLSDLSESDNGLDASSVEARAPVADTRLKEFLWKSASESTSWQAVSSTSFIQGIGLDWLLVPLDSSLGPYHNAIDIGQSKTFPRTIHPREVSEDLPADDGHITIVAGKSGYQRVRPSRTLSGIFIPSAGRIVKVWSVKHKEGAIGPGDSGSWAVGDEGEIFGYLVATCEQLGASYVAPLATAMADIRARHGIKDVSIPGPAYPSPRAAVSDRVGGLLSLHEDRMVETRRIVGTSGNEERLDHRYRIRPDAKKFFEIGRVFALLWHESAGGGGGPGGKRVTELSNPIAVTGRFGEEVYSHIRRMVVVKAEHRFCLCLPINTYDSKGVTKSGLSESDRRAHTIVYMTDTRPFSLPEEREYLTKKPIAVEKASTDQKLDPMSRLNFKKIYTIEHNVKVMSIGRVTRDSLPALLGYWRQSLAD